MDLESVRARFRKYLDGRLSPAELKELEGWIRSDPSLADLFVDESGTDALQPKGIEEIVKVPDTRGREKVSGDDTTIHGTDKDIGDLLVNRGIITPHQLQMVARVLKDRPGTKLGDLLVDVGYLKDTAILDAVRIQTRVMARCSACSKDFQIFYHNPASKYSCKACGAELKTDTDSGSATIALTSDEVRADKGTTSTGSATETVSKADSGADTKSGSSSSTGSDPTFIIPATDSDAREGTITSKPGRVKSTEPPMPPEVMAAAQDPKRIFGKYVITKELGRGGYAIVYKAWDKLLAQYCALKFIRSQDMNEGGDSSGSESASTEIQDFQREARMAARLRHPNIVRIYEMGTYDNKHYLAMELMEGRSFFEAIHGGSARNLETHFHDNPEKFLTIVRDVARAVDYAHSQEPPVIHRDLKPHNVLMDAKGQAYVADFGLAKEVTMSDRTGTVSGVVKGTPAYMAPEQAEGHSKDTDQRTDVYSLGAVLYEVLTGRPPFVGDNVRQILNQIVMKLPDRPNEMLGKMALEKNPTAPEKPKLVARELETICLKALEKKKNDRYQSAKVFADDIDRFLQHLDIEAREPGVYRKFLRSCRAHPLISGAAAAILLCAGVATGAVKLIKPKGGGADQLVTIAEQHLKDQHWTDLKSSLDNLKQFDPKHPRIEEFQTEIDKHEAELVTRKQKWTDALKAFEKDRVKTVIDGLRPAFKEAGELKDDFSNDLNTALLKAQAAAIGEARNLYGSGARVEWQENPQFKQKARPCRDQLTDLLALAKDADFPFAASLELGARNGELDRILAYEGLWDLRVNVAPFAHITLRQGDKVMQEYTPYAIRGLEVHKGYQLEIAWPDKDKPTQKVVKDLKDLKHGVTVVVSGDITKADVEVGK